MNFCLNVEFVILKGDLARDIILLLVLAIVMRVMGLGCLLIRAKRQ